MISIQLNPIKMTNDDYPEEGELVLATVINIFGQGAFVSLEEYGGKKGMLHITEISLKWVRNIRDYVREGQKVVLKVLRVNPQRGHIDLSLRRVTNAQRKEKLHEVKRKQRSEKLLELLAEKIGVDFNELYERMDSELTRRFGSIYDGLDAIALDNKIADEFDIDNNLKSELIRLVNQSIKPPQVEITGYVKLTSYEPNGVDIVKESLQEIENYKTDCTLTLSYISAPIYRIHVKATDYKTAERVMRDSTNLGIDCIKRHHGIGEFYRKLEKI